MTYSFHYGWLRATIRDASSRDEALVHLRNILNQIGFKF